MFRFHPTDEELVGFYLQRRVQNKSLRTELIKQVDIYKYDPWDLPKFSNVVAVGEKEWYFFCKRRRKYNNSIRPNRVITGSGFWKATGIDKPEHSSGRDNCVIGLKKSLVYYRGRAGKGHKTHWMMHEFRLLSGPDHKIHGSSNYNNYLDSETNLPPEAVRYIYIYMQEVWTLCRILKRDNSNKKINVRSEATSAKRSSFDDPILMDARSKTYSTMEYCDKNSGYVNINFPTSVLSHEIDKKHDYSHDIDHNLANQQFPSHFSSTSIKSHDQAPASVTNSSSSTCGDHINELIKDAGDWEDLRCILDSSSFAPTMNPFYL